jgi:hypothetical protein
MDRSHRSTAAIGNDQNLIHHLSLLYQTFSAAAIPISGGISHFLNVVRVAELATGFDPSQRVVASKNRTNHIHPTVKNHPLHLSNSLSYTLYRATGVPNSKNILFS